MAIVRRIVAWLIFLGFVGGLIWLFYWRQQQERPISSSAKIPTVRVHRPVIRDLPIRLTYPAELQAIQAYEMRPIEAKGFVKRVTVDKGDKVRQGQLLVEVDCPEYHARRKQAREGIRSVRAMYTNAKILLDRLKPMLGKNFVSQLEVDSAQASFDSAEARFKNEEARLSEVEHVLSFCQIRAPFDGEVAMRFVDPGEQVRPGGRALLSIVTRSLMRVQLNVIERDDPYLREGLPAELTIHGLTGHTFQGRVTRVVRQLDPKTRTFVAEIEIPNPKGVLQPGMFGRVGLVVDRHARAILVPAAAILATDNGTFVYVVRDKRAHRIPIQTGHDTGDEVEVVKGLTGNELVVTVGRDLLKQGAPVNTVE